MNFIIIVLVSEWMFENIQTFNGEYFLEIVGETNEIKIVSFGALFILLMIILGFRIDGQERVVRFHGVYNK
jgi:hypothetical protein